MVGWHFNLCVQLSLSQHWAEIIRSGMIVVLGEGEAISFIAMEL